MFADLFSPTPDPRVRASDDFSTMDGAQSLVQTIREFWAEQGYAVLVELRVGPFNKARRSCGYEIHSDLVNGLPRDHPSPASTRET